MMSEVGAWCRGTLLRQDMVIWMTTRRALRPPCGSVEGDVDAGKAFEFASAGRSCMHRRFGLATIAGLTAIALVNVAPEVQITARTKSPTKCKPGWKRL